MHGDAVSKYMNSSKPRIEQRLNARQIFLWTSRVHHWQDSEVLEMTITHAMKLLLLRQTALVHPHSEVPETAIGRASQVLLLYRTFPLLHSHAACVYASHHAVSAAPPIRIHAVRSENAFAA